MHRNLATWIFLWACLAVLLTVYYCDNDRVINRVFSEQVGD